MAYYIWEEYTCRQKQLALQHVMYVSIIPAGKKACFMHIIYVRNVPVDKNSLLYEILCK